VKISPEKAWEVLDAAEQVCSATVASEAVRRLAQDITARLRASNPLVLGVMRGSIVFAGHILPRLEFPLEFDYIDVTRYDNTTSGGVLTWKVTPGKDVAGRVVLLLDDILDEGHTLAAIREELLAAGAHEFYSAVFAEKETGRPKPVAADFVGVKLPNRYVFGFGMDVNGMWRNLPAVYALKED